MLVAPMPLDSKVELETMTRQSAAGIARFTSKRSESDTFDGRNWDELAAGFDDISLDQTAAYTDAKWGQARSSHLVLRDGDTVVAGARVLLLKLPFISRGVAFVKYGPVWWRQGRQADPKTYRAVVEALIEEYCQRRRMLLTIQPRAHPEYSDVEQEMLREIGFFTRENNADPERYLVNLDLDEEAQKKSLSAKWRLNLRKSLATGVEVRLVDLEEGIGEFASLHGQMVARKNAARKDPIELMSGISRRLPNRIAPRLVFAYHDGIPVAGAVIAIHGDTAYFVFGATSDAALATRAGYALQWWIINWLSREGPQWYDLGGACGSSGLRQFKSGLVGQAGRIVQMPHEMQYCCSRSDRIAGNCVFTGAALLRNAADALAYFR